MGVWRLFLKSAEKLNANAARRSMQGEILNHQRFSKILRKKPVQLPGALHLPYQGQFNFIFRR